MAEEVEFFELDFEVLYNPGRDAHVIGVAMVAVVDVQSIVGRLQLL